MESYDSQPEKHQSDKLWNALASLTLLGVLLVLGAFLVIFFNPESRLNPFPPPPLPVVASIPTSTPTSVVALPPTFTPTNEVIPSTTPTDHPTATTPPTATPFTLVTSSVTPTSTKHPEGHPFKIQKGSPVAIANIYHPELACEWMGVGGQVVDMSGGPLTGLVVHLGGYLPGITISQHMMTLTGVALSYGHAGYEFTIADKPIASKGSLWIQLLNQAGGPLSEKVYFDTYKSCEKNLIIINFKQVR